MKGKRNDQKPKNRMEAGRVRLRHGPYHKGVASMIECSCKSCQNACQYKPGWFKPAQIPVLAKNMGITEKELFDKYLGVDWYVGDEPTFALAPATIDMEPGAEYPGNPRGTCVFFKGGKCSIHTIGKPIECAQYLHGDKKKVTDARKVEITAAWKNPRAKAKIKKLLGRTPKAEAFSIFDAMSLFIDLKEKS